MSDKTRLRVEEMLDRKAYPAKNDSCKGLSRKSIEQKELKSHLQKDPKDSPLSETSSRTATGSVSVFILLHIIISV